MNLSQLREFFSRVMKTLARNRMMSIGVSALLALVILLICFSGAIRPALAPRVAPTIFATPAPETVSAEGTVLPVQRASLAFKMAGRVAQIPVKEGDSIKSGATLARLDDSTLQAQVTQADAAYRAAQVDSQRVQATNASNIAVAKANLDKVLAGPTQQEIAVAQGRVQEASTALARAQQSYDILRWAGGPTEADVRFKRDQALASYNTAVANLNQLKARARPEDIAVAQAQLDLARGDAGKAEIRAVQAQASQTKAALDVAQAALQDTALIAPFDATVALVSIEVNQSVAPG